MNDLYEKIDIKKIIKYTYLKYAFYIIKERTIPDIRDGLKPVHRRIIYAMYKLKNFYNNPHKKSARIVGDVIGKYHPHGDISIYKAIIKMTQKFFSRYPLIDGQGNFGTIDNDPAAAMRYTEIKLSKFANNLIEDLNIKNLETIKNYDNSENIPIILPTKVPNILLNGTMGISVGMKTFIPPHNLSDTINCCLKYILNKNISIEELIYEIKGPDFPTGGIINQKDLKNIYLLGYGSFEIISDIQINLKKKEIIINSLPYQVSKNEILNKLLLLIKNKKIAIHELTDNSEENKICIKIKIKDINEIEIIKEKLLNLTKLKKKYYVNMLVIDNNKPCIVNLKQIIEKFIIFRKTILLKKKKEEIKIIKNKINNNLILLYITKNINILISFIKNKKNLSELIHEIQEISLLNNTIKNPFIYSYLKKNNKINEDQIKKLLNKKIIFFKNIKVNIIINETIINIKKLIEIEKIINNEIYLEKIIINELELIKETYKDLRYTQILY